MCLKIVLNNELLFDNIIKHLDQKSKISLSQVDKECNSIMKHCGYFENILFKCDNLDNYMKSLDLLDIHKRTVKRIIIIRQLDIFSYLPKNIENKYEVIFKNCRVYVTNKDIEKRLEKIKFKNCLIKNDVLNYYVNKE